MWTTGNLSNKGVHPTTCLFLGEHRGASPQGGVQAAEEVQLSPLWAGASGCIRCCACNAAVRAPTGLWTSEHLHAKRAQQASRPQY